MAKTDFALLAIGTLLSLFAAIILIDLVAATGAEACGGGGSTTNCYPRGTEGPAAESWRYQSKSIYLASGFPMAILPIIATASIAPKIMQGEQLTRNHRAFVGIAFAATLVLLLA